LNGITWDGFIWDADESEPEPIDGEILTAIAGVIWWSGPVAVDDDCNWLIYTADPAEREQLMDLIVRRSARQVCETTGKHQCGGRLVAKDEALTMLAGRGILEAAIMPGRGHRRSTRCCSARSRRSLPREAVYILTTLLRPASSLR